MYSAVSPDASARVAEAPPRRIPRGGRVSLPYWWILVAIGLTAGAGIFLTAGQQLSIRRDFYLFSDHAMQAAFHLHRMAMRVAELSGEDLSTLPEEARAKALDSYRITIAALYANVEAGSFESIRSILGDARPGIYEAIQADLRALNRSMPELLALLRQTRSEKGGLEPEALRRGITPAALLALRDAQRLNDSIRFAEALTFSALSRAMSRSGLIAAITIVSFAFIAIGSFLIMRQAAGAARLREEALRGAKETAERLLDSQREFLANTSHELRTPAAGLLGMARLLADEKLEDRAGSYARKLLSAAEDLAALVDSVLESQSEPGKEALPAEWLSLSAALEPVIERYRFRAEEKGLGFELRKESPGAELYSSPAALRIVLAALLSNAVKFTDSGSILLELSASERGLGLLIRDTGIGMSEETLARATERFYQGESSYIKRHRGLGLGLWTAKRSVEALGGRLSLRSELGKGTEASFELLCPFRPAPASVASLPAAGDGDELREPEIAAAAGGQSAILVAEDDAINRLYLVTFLAKAGYQVIATVDGRSALEAAEKGGFQLAILDISMPYHTGIEVARSIRDKERESDGPPVTLFALTGHSTPKDRLDCLEAGFDEFLTKPFELSALLALVARALPSAPNITEIG